MGWECRMMKKYELTDESIEHVGHKLYRIKALRSFSNVKQGDLGGYIEKEDNLSHDGDCWIYGNARVSDNASVYGDAHVSGNAMVSGNALIYDNARVFDNARVCGNAKVSGDARLPGRIVVDGESKISGNCILKFNGWIWLKNIILDHGIWTDSYTVDNKTYIISNTLEQLYIGDIE
jgi:UDP-3-O-[3-hydroxymyristoyl] glucosamine N-acyltransferase